MTMSITGALSRMLGVYGVAPVLHVMEVPVYIYEYETHWYPDQDDERADCCMVLDLSCM